jgi:recombination DNA repair RAD52 pathway protein
MFTPDQQAILEGMLDKSKVKPRKGANGRTVSYVEGWYVVDMANEVFGFGNWDAETVEMKREHDPVRRRTACPDRCTVRSRRRASDKRDAQMRALVLKLGWPSLWR